MDLPTTPEQVGNLEELQAQSVKALALLVGVAAYGWFTYTVWPESGLASPGNWAGSTCLLAGACISLLLYRRRLQAAAVSLVAGSLGGVFFAVLTFRMVQLAHLFSLVVAFASVVLSPLGVFLTAGVAAGLTAALGAAALGPGATSRETLIPMLTVIMFAVVSWLSARNLHKALAWVWHGYEHARTNERIAQQRGAELRQALKALDEATYRLQRSNYMLAVARDQADEARRLKQQFAQTISHELRTPLNLIVGFTEMMADSPEYYGSQLPAPYARDLTIIHRNAQHLQSLVTDVLDLARVEAAQMSVVAETVSPAALVQEAVTTARSLVEARGLSLGTAVDPSLPDLYVDPIRIRQVLFNLLSNAARFTEQGGVFVRVSQRDSEIVFSVADTGVGIAAEDIPRVFEDFRQVDGSARRRHGGAGLGLAISRRFVELHGGRIWVESTVGVGSTFFFSLPLSTSDLTLGHPAQGMLPGGVRPGRYPEERILLAITDNPSGAGFLSRYLRRCRVVIGPDTVQARLMAQQHLPQVVLLDTCHDATSPQGLERLAAEWPLERAVFVACPLPVVRDRQVHSGVSGYLVKPVSRLNLWDMLRGLGEGIDRVLVIDDDRDFCRLMARMLDSPVRRYEVSAAHDGERGLEMVRTDEPDLVLLDLNLPDIPGLQVLDGIRACPQGRDVPVVIVSAAEELGSASNIAGSMWLTAAKGLTPSLIIRWLQHLLDSGAQSDSSGDGAEPLASYEGATAEARTG